MRGAECTRLEARGLGWGTRLVPRPVPRGHAAPEGRPLALRAETEHLLTRLVTAGGEVSVPAHAPPDGSGARGTSAAGLQLARSETGGSVAPCSGQRELPGRRAMNAGQNFL